jgi:hypothetical protein
MAVSRRLRARRGARASCGRPWVPSGPVEAHADAVGSGRRTPLGGWAGSCGVAGGVPGNARLTLEKGLVLPSWLWCSCAAGPVNYLHVHWHMHLSRGREGSRSTSS